MRFFKSLNKLIRANFYALLIFSVFICQIPNLFGQTIVINEFMSSNSNTIADEDGDFEDWIELYNPGNASVDLYGYYLSDDYSNPYKWRFPEVAIYAGEFMLVWASGKDRTEPFSPLHTNFSISREGEELILTHASGERLDELWPVTLPADMSFGRYPDGTGSWLYMQHPTPGQENAPHINDTMLLHYFVFTNDLPNNTPLQTLNASYSLAPGGHIQYNSCLEGYPFHADHPLWRKASLERRNRPTAINYFPGGNHDIAWEDSNMRGVQISQPLRSDGRQNTMFFHLPATGFKNLVLRFAAMDEGAAQSLMIDYSADNVTDEWLSDPGLIADPGLTDHYRLYESDFSHIAEANNNPKFRIRIRFESDEPTADKGDRVTFNNISLHGTPLAQHYIHSGSGENGLISPYGFTRVYEGGSQDYSIYPTLNHVVEKVLVNGINRIDETVFDENGIGTYTFSDVSATGNIYASFVFEPVMPADSLGGILFYPNPAREVIHILAKQEFRKIAVYDLNGRKVYSSATTTARYSLPLSNFRAGAYIASIHFENKTVSRRFLVVR